MHTQGLCPLPDGGALAYETTGLDRRSTPVLLIRPLGGTLALWGHFRASLAREVPVVAFDARGGGRSTGAPRISTKAMAHDARALLDHLGIETAHVYGQSLGGMVATLVAADAPSRVATLVLASTASSGVAFRSGGVVAGARFAACLARRDGELEACLADRVVSTWMLRDPDGRERLEKAKAILRATPTSRRSIVAQAVAGATHFALTATSRIVSPALTLAGAHDKVLGLAPQQALANAIHGSRLEVIAGAGHDITLERPDDVAARVLRFIQRSACAVRTSHPGPP